MVPPYGQANFTNENFPGSVQTQVTGINNTGTTVGFWANGVGTTASNFGWVNVNGSFTVCHLLVDSPAERIRTNKDCTWIGGR